MSEIINQLKLANSRKEVSSILDTESLESRYYLLKEAIDILNNEIELNIKSNHTKLALFEMSRVVMLEDEFHIVERIILKQGVASL